MASLHLARNEAIKRNGRVVLCKTTDGIHCAASGGWEQGWIVFHDVNNNSLREESEQIIQHQIALSGSLRMTGNTPVARYVSYGPMGGTQLVGGAFQAGTLTLCQRVGVRRRCPPDHLERGRATAHAESGDSQLRVSNRRISAGLRRPVS